MSVKGMAALTWKIGIDEDINAFYDRDITMLEEAQIKKMSQKELHGKMKAGEPNSDIWEKLLEIDGQPSISQVHDNILKWRMRKMPDKQKQSRTPS